VEDIMHPTKPSNTQVYSPLGSFVVEQHDETERHHTVKRRYEDDAFGCEKGVAIAWTLLIAGLLIGSIYNRLGKPEITATSPAQAAIIGTVGSASTHSSD
jgi:hypothetical protein